MANPILSHLVSGTVKDIFGTKLAEATVSLKHTSFNQTLPNVLTGSDGKYIINLGGENGLDSQWSKGGEIQVTASKTAEGTKTVTATITSGGGQTVNLTLAETSTLTFDTNPVADEDIHNLNFSLITHYDGEKVTRLRPFPVQAPIDIDLVYNPTHTWAVTNQDGQPDSETVTLADGNSYKRTFSYVNISGARILTTRSKWLKQ